LVKKAAAVKRNSQQVIEGGVRIRWSKLIPIKQKKNPSLSTSHDKRLIQNTLQNFFSFFARQRRSWNDTWTQADATSKTRSDFTSGTTSGVVAMLERREMKRGRLMSVLRQAASPPSIHRTISGKTRPDGRPGFHALSWHHHHNKNRTS
jgi:hypothetical protein